MPTPTKLREMIAGAVRLAIIPYHDQMTPEQLSALVTDGVMRAIAEYDPCFAKAAELGEPTFTLRAQDKTADYHVDAWSGKVRFHGAPIEKCRDAERIAEAMRAWPKRRLPD